MRHSFPTRRGFTLVELMIVITLFALALSAVAILLKGVLQANRTAENHRAITRSIQRLAIQFRDDIHSASAVNLKDNELIAHVPQTQNSTTYQVDGNSIHRIEALGQQVNRDEFELPSGAIATFDDDVDGTRSLASLVLTYPLNSSQPKFSNRRTLRIEAAVGGTRSSSGVQP